jgi:arylsulfatase A-like enzyme
MTHCYTHLPQGGLIPENCGKGLSHGAEMSGESEACIVRCVLFAVLAWTIVSGNCLADSGTTARQPNIILLLIDDLGWSDVSCYGQRLWHTPNIDRLAAEGMKFTDAYAASPVCSPTRAAILSGKYPQRLHVTCHIGGGGNYKVPHDARVLPSESGSLSLAETTIAEALKAGGYATAMIGKWHVGEHAREQGFDASPCFAPGNGCKRFQGPERRFMTDVKGDAAVQWIEQQSDEPFFLYFSTHAVHTGIAASKEYIEDHVKRGLPQSGPWNATYAAYVQHVDENIGRILDKLETSGIADNTVVIFHSDNGGRGLDISRNDPLGGAKGQLYEGGIRVPTLIRWPGVTKPGSVCSVPIVSTDIYPTLLDIAGLPPRHQQHRDGICLTPLLQGAKSLNRVNLYWHYPHYSTVGVPSSAVRQGEWKLIEFYGTYRRRWEDDAQSRDNPSDRGVGVGYQVETEIELYNLTKDIGETTNLACEMPDRAAELRRLLYEHLSQIGAALPRRLRREK